MLICVTGVPGAGKTLNTLAMVDTEKRFLNRPVYQFGIKECSMPGWTALDRDEVFKWHELPHGSVLIVDEAYDIFPVRKVGDKVPQHVDETARHRHLGIDIILICQHPHQLDTFVRKMVGNHFHFDRPFGLPRSRRYEWQKIVAEPNDYFAKKEAIVKSLPLPKKYFPFYKSAEIHTHKVRFPPKLIGLGVIILIALGLGYRVYSKHSGSSDSSVNGNVSSVLPVVGAGSAPKTADQYIEQYRPRVEGLAYTAPVYDQAFQVKTFPKPNCIASASRTSERAGCRCYSQQGTKLDVPEPVCRHFVENGWFDPTKDERNESDRGQLAQSSRKEGRQPSFNAVGVDSPSGTAKVGIDSYRSSSF